MGSYIHISWVLWSAALTLTYLILLSYGVFIGLNRKKRLWSWSFVLLKGVPFILIGSIFSKNSSLIEVVSLTLGVTLGTATFCVGVILKPTRQRGI